MPGQDARINVFGFDHSGLGSMAGPLISGALKAFEVEVFSGNPEDVEEFDRKWTLYLRMLQESVGCALPDGLVLGHLRMKLDEGNRAILDAELAMQPNLTYYEFYETFLERNRKDAQTMHHSNWRQVKLQMTGPAGRELTKKDWDKFRANYLMKRSRVEGWSEIIDYEQIFGQLPGYFQQAVVKEQCRRRAGKNWVRVSIPKGLEMKNILQQMKEEVQRELFVVRTNGTHFVVECPNPEVARALLGIDGCMLDGETVRIQKAEYTMEGNDIFAFVDHLLMEENELRGLQQTCGTASRNNKRSEPQALHFRAVSTEVPKAPLWKRGKRAPEFWGRFWCTTKFTAS